MKASPPAIAAAQSEQVGVVDTLGSGQWYSVGWRQDLDGRYDVQSPDKTPVYQPTLQAKE
jgi:hypothetical protein